MARIPRSFTLVTLQVIWARRLKMASSCMVPGSITRRGLEESGMDTRSVGALGGGHVGRRGMTGHLHLDSAGVGVGVGGAAIRGGEAGIIMGSSRQRGPIHLAPQEI